MLINLSPSWQEILAPELEKTYFQTLSEFVDNERARYTIYPKENETFSALEYTPYDQVTRPHPGSRSLPWPTPGAWLLFLGASARSPAAFVGKYL